MEFLISLALVVVAIVGFVVVINAVAFICDNFPTFIEIAILAFGLLLVTALFHSWRMEDKNTPRNAQEAVESTQTSKEVPPYVVR